jgi:hypothetical protein
MGVRLLQVIQNKRVLSLSKEALGNEGAITRGIKGRPVSYFNVRFFLSTLFCVRVGDGASSPF